MGDVMFEIYQGKDDKWYWRYKAGNGQITATGGQGYASKGGCTKAVNKFLDALGWVTPK